MRRQTFRAVNKEAEAENSAFSELRNRIDEIIVFAPLTWLRCGALRHYLEK